MISIAIHKCPYCSRIYKIDVGFDDKLGPSNILCGRCHRQFTSELVEWVNFSTLDKIGFWILTLIGMIFGGYFISVGLFILFTNKLFVNENWQDWRFISLYVIMGLLFLILRIICIRLSKFRVKVSTEQQKLSILTWYVNLSTYYLSILISLLILVIITVPV